MPSTSKNNASSNNYLYKDLSNGNISTDQKKLSSTSVYPFSQNLNTESTELNQSNTIEKSLYNLGFIGDRGKNLNTDMLETSMNNFFSSNFFGPSDNSVFNLNDPIWKPIFKDDDAEKILKFSSIWPTDFSNKTNKKHKND